MTEASYLFGPAGWSYKDWEGTVYPQQKDKDFNPLLFLSQVFQFVEVNTAFYRIPSPRLTQGWVKKTEEIPWFNFWVKVYQGFTHERKVKTPDVNNFKAALEPLNQSSQLAGLLIQYPYSFRLNTGNLNYVLALSRVFNEYIQAIEFRHSSWNRVELFEVFKEKKLVWVNIDQPEISSSLPLTSVLTHPEVSYFRLHGRNYESWFSNEGRDARYNYNYNAFELDKIARKIKELSTLAKKIFISGNNHYKGNAVRNLQELKKLLGTSDDPDSEQKPVS